MLDSVDFNALGKNNYCDQVWNEHNECENISKFPYDLCFYDSTYKDGYDIEVLIWFEKINADMLIQEKTTFFTIKIPAYDACEGEN